ncbi:DNA-{apurinic or apyrimidinic site} lyase/endonuclease III [Geoglobus ahangari]|uniref:Endonuclease III n=1 Tax=Geoglobus ahangari TaxID=113653 RepID=A0A0F7IHF1_9EURY|nr:endonuclease III [Geoglobus ahangari]AKG92124.1 DNA-{apurinic or apyrimidinic site} lyase/endonuclease III [Geoglobus ahangari]
MDLDRVLDIMEEEAKRRNAPIYALKERTTDPFRVLVAAILSTRTRDEQTAEVAKRLFERVKSVEDLRRIPEEELAELIRGVGFYRNKARMLKALAEKLDGERIPSTMDELLELPGVGRKVANIVLSEAFGVNTIAVDTHVHRISNRLGLVSTKTPEETERELKRIVPERLWRRVNKAFVGYGQTICRPVNPRCSECRVAQYCNYFEKSEQSRKV